MAFTIAQFRLDFPEFDDDAVYTDSMITFWSNFGMLLNSPIWYGAVYDYVIELFTAHEITIQAANIAASQAGSGVLTPTSGTVSQKEVGSVTVEYDTSASVERDAGYYNRTTYGQQYWILDGIYGQGVIQI